MTPLPKHMLRDRPHAGHVSLWSAVLDAARIDYMDRIEQDDIEEWLQEHPCNALLFEAMGVDHHTVILEWRAAFQAQQDKR